MGAKHQVLTTRFLNVSGLDGSDWLSYSGKIRYIGFVTLSVIEWIGHQIKKRFERPEMSAM